jgi:copper(I)-binding protein
MKIISPATLCTVLLTVLAMGSSQSAPAQAVGSGTYRIGAIVVEAPWSREAPGGVKRAVGYMRITNTGQHPDRLVGGTAATTGRLEVHQSTTSDGLTQMQAIKDGLVIGPGESVELKPGAMHGMLVDLPRGPKAGEIIKGTLMFERAGAIEIEYQVGSVGIRHAPTAAASHHH